MVKQGKGLRYNLLLTTTSYVKVHTLHFLGQKPTMLITPSYRYVVKTTVALGFKGTLVMKKKPAKMLVAAHHCITSKEFLGEVMDEILVSFSLLCIHMKLPRKCVFSF